MPDAAGTSIADLIRYGQQDAHGMLLGTVRNPLRDCPLLSGGLHVAFEESRCNSLKDKSRNPSGDEVLFLE